LGAAEAPTTARDPFRHRLQTAGTEGTEANPIENPVEPGAIGLGSAANLPEGPIDPATYVVGPGDGLVVLAWGAAEITHPVKVDPEGRVFIPSVGLVDIGGHTLSDARELVREAVLDVYQRVTVDLVLQAPRQFKVHVVGDGAVLFPGSYAATAVTRVSELIELAGGLTANASNRRIRLRRGDRETFVDLAGFLLTGRLDLNPFVVDGAVIEVPKRAETVLLSGSVANAAYFELLPGERLSDLLAATGGFAPGADTTCVVLSRLDEEAGSRESTFVFVAGGAETSDPTLREGDRVYVRERENWRRSAEVYLYGAVRRAGRFPIPLEGARLSVVLKEAGGVTERANLYQAHILRPQQRYTRAPLREDFSDYTIDPARYNDADVSANIDSLVVECDLHALLIQNDASADVVVFDQDVIRIPEDRHEVRVLGRVRTPGAYALRSGASIDDYIREAGGFDRDADKGRTSLARFDGAPLRKADRGREAASGSIIYVPTRDRISSWQRAREALGFVVQLASLVVIVDRFVAN
jgi:protein involved in polysaccharide export with SLBB domain